MWKADKVPSIKNQSETRDSFAYAVATEAKEAASAQRHDPVARAQVMESLAVWVDNWLANHNKVFIWRCSVYFLLCDVFPRVCWR